MVKALRGKGHINYVDEMSNTGIRPIVMSKRVSMEHLPVFDKSPLTPNLWDECVLDANVPTIIYPDVQDI